MLEGQFSESAFDTFQDVFQGPNILHCNTDLNIAKKASELRNHSRNNKLKLFTPDAIHLATALIHDVSEFHTTDARLLSLSVSYPDIYKFQIKEPIGQYSLLSNINENAGYKEQ